MLLILIVFDCAKKMEVGLYNTLNYTTAPSVFQRRPHEAKTKKKLKALYLFTLHIAVPHYTLTHAHYKCASFYIFFLKTQ